jgi:hypothetical protein
VNVAKFVTTSSRAHSHRQTTRMVALIVAALASGQTPVFAGAVISGTPEAVTLNAQDTSIADILAGLGHDFDVHYRSSADLNRHLTGTYRGSLRQVVTRILDGYNFIVASIHGGVEVTVLGKEKAQTPPAAPSSVGVPWPANFPKR